MGYNRPVYCNVFPYALIKRFIYSYIRGNKPGLPDCSAEQKMLDKQPGLCYNNQAAYCGLFKLCLFGVRAFE